VSTTWANKAYRNSYYGVSASESHGSGLAATTLDAGWLDTSVTVSAEVKFNALWRLSGQWVLVRLNKTVAASPVVQQRRQDLATLTLWRSF
jgi:outer membrane scaffolding protein for murein synthesis (MipA/OmpV family)